MNDREHWLRRYVIHVAIPLLIILAPTGLSLVDRLAAGDPDDAPFLEIPESAGTVCIRDTDYMRYHHWELLRQVRDEAVRDGVRGAISLTGCRQCHPDRGVFCNRCHDAVSLQPDCFGCHDYPASTSTTGAGGHASGEVSASWIADGS